MYAATAAGGVDSLYELLEWRYAHRETAIGSAVFQRSPLTPRLIEAQENAMLEILDAGSLSELTADEVRLAAWEASQ